MIKHRPTMLMILDGYGIREESHGNAIAAANKPNLDRLFAKYPFITLEASGEYVGLPDGQIGNSEVGHTNIGAGNVVLQDLPRINKSISTGEFYTNKVLLEAMENAASGHTLHIMGLCSDGGVHSKLEHLYAVLEMAKRSKVKNVVIHCYLDGRDVPPRSAMTYLGALEDKCNELGVGRIGIISGRFYAMDRDKRWERLEPAYDALTLSEGVHASGAAEAIRLSYGKNESDEFVRPTVVDATPVRDGDSVVFINYRPDRAREITRALVDPDFDGFDRKKLPQNLTYVCMTEYDVSMPNVKVAFPPEVVEPTLGGVVSAAGLTQLRIAETEKYAHVTFFFNGGVEAPVAGEDRILVPSPKVTTYDLQPEMSAPILTEKVLDAIDSDKYDLIILNFANPDMVGHTGVFDAAVSAIEMLDGLVQQIAERVLSKDGQILLTADHGNADYMLDDNDNVVTKHSLSPVPLCHIANEPSPFNVPHGKLADIAPTLLTLMRLDVPKEMKGEVLV
ncbi:2,3-bisphosphoglycerate-independent phosphoglycerate mutase [Mogibacterium timidum]|uniref:2,3-bisphosphoglycerate-independent phosphoglycerate mutase n=1 Tax=Mogibacterium timidum TaxID=35519 RepID=UPI002F42EF6D